MQQRVDKTALKVNQAYIVSLLLLAFLLGDQAGPFIVAVVGGVMAVGTVFPQWNLFRVSYLTVFKPLGVLKPNVMEDDPAPHRFAFGVGAAFLIAALAAFAFSLYTVGWVLSWIVIVLAFVNFTINFCLGCFVYYQLGKAGLIPRPRRRHG